jgi:preprotein translocase subunit SecY
MFRRLAILFTDKELLKKLALVFGLALLTRLILFIPLPFVRINDYVESINNPSSGLSSLLNSVIGSAYGTVSIVMLGIGPYITASIVMQLLTVIVPKLQKLQEEGGSAAQMKINQYTRALTFGLAFVTGFAILSNIVGPTSTSNPFAHVDGLNNFSITNGQSVLLLSLLSFMLACGSMFLMWICEIISETKIISGASLIILVSSLSSIRKTFVSSFDGFAQNLSVIKTNFKPFDWNFYQDLFGRSVEYTPTRTFLLLLLVSVVSLVSVIFINEAIKNIPLLYTRKGGLVNASRLINSVKSSLPIRITGAGLMGIIIAISFVALPVVLDNLSAGSNSDAVKKVTQDFRCFISQDNIFNNNARLTSNDTLTAKCLGVNDADLQTYTNNQSQLVATKIPKVNFLNFFFSQNADELKAAQDVNITDGQEVFAFSISTFKGDNAGVFKNQFSTGYTNPFNDKSEKIETPKFMFNPGNLLPEFGIRFNGILAYFLVYFLLIVAFNYFFTLVVQNSPDKISKDLSRLGAYIPGVNPGDQTVSYLGKAISIVIIPGAIFTALIAVVPYLLPALFGQGAGNVIGVIAGTQLFIIVSTSLELIRNLDAETSIADYERFAEFS